MKIVISTDIYYPMINGVAVFSRNLATGLKKRGHQVMVLAPSITGKFGVEKDEEGGFTVVRQKSRRMYLYPDQIEKVPDGKKVLGVKVPQLVYKNGLHVSYNPYSDIKRVLDEFKPDIIDGHWLNPQIEPLFHLFHSCLAHYECHFSTLWSSIRYRLVTFLFLDALDSLFFNTELTGNSTVT